MIKTETKVFSLTLLALCAASEVQAAGYQLNDYSMTGLGRAYAGAGIVGDDFSALAFNPAGMALNGSGLQAGVTMVQQHGQLRGTAAKGGSPVTSMKNVNVWSTLPQFFGQYKINDTFTAGLGIYAPFGLATKYGNGWFGSDQGITSSLGVVDIAPALSVRLNSHFTVGAAFIARYVTGTMSNTLMGGYTKFEIDGWQTYGSFGIMYEYDQDTRFGISYRTENDHTVKGDFIAENMGPLTGVYGGQSTTPLPQHILLSAYKKHGSFGYSASARWTKWDCFDTFTLGAPEVGLSKTVTYNWRNSWTISAGLDYFYDDQWTFRLGTAYDQSPAKGPQNRTARIPDSDRYWASFGFSYAITKQLKVDAAYTHLFLKKYRVTQASEDLTYDVGANVFGVQLQYAF